MYPSIEEVILLPSAFRYPTSGKGKSALSVKFAVPEVADVFVATEQGKGPKQTIQFLIVVELDEGLPLQRRKLGDVLAVTAAERNAFVVRSQSCAHTTPLAAIVTTIISAVSSLLIRLLSFSYNVCSLTSCSVSPFVVPLRDPLQRAC